ncbi:hypothetical protein QE152_g22428 [Popillia japonica]|uniref:Uncharacterized protein n=1 Tax=Popillia japonica TaxID=7064 RepID=A0AAW1KKQ0_POPJA
MKTKKDEHIRQRKDPARYKVGDLLAIKRTQQGPGLKLRAQYLGPYQVTKVKPCNSYDVIKKGDHHGIGIKNSCHTTYLTTIQTIFCIIYLSCGFCNQKYPIYVRQCVSSINRELPKLLFCKSKTTSAITKILM